MAVWKKQVKGKRGSDSWEISDVREDNEHGQLSWGWFDENKILISHNGNPCDWPMAGYVFDQQLVIADEVARRLNAGESIDA